MHESTLQTVVTLEPWRQRIGYPESVTDPDWTAEGHEMCPASSIIRDAEDPRFWHCRDCGYIGWSTTELHRPVLSPKAFLKRCRDFFLRRRQEQGLGSAEANHQMQHVMAVALRCAAAKSPSELRRFLEGMLRL